MIDSELSVDEVAEAIGIPTADWPGACYGIAVAMLKADLVPGGEPRYGHWLGPVSPDCPVGSFYRSHENGAPFQRHGWACIPGDPEMVVDPTRWVFEGCDPYIYVGAADHYDAGGNTFREATMRPAPAYSASAKRANIAIWKFCPDAHRFVTSELLDGSPGITMDQVVWLANLPLGRLGLHARAIYQAIEDSGEVGFIPIDNYRLVFGQVDHEKS